MDNHKFDLLIAQKLSQIEPEFDPQAWSNMDQMLESVSPLPWYQRPNYKVITLAATLFTLINAGLLYFNLSERSSKQDALTASSSIEPNLTYLDLSSFELPEVVIIGSKIKLRTPSNNNTLIASSNTTSHQKLTQDTKPTKYPAESAQSKILASLPNTKEEESSTAKKQGQLATFGLFDLDMLEPFGGVDLILVDQPIGAAALTDDYYQESPMIASRFGFTTGMNQQYGDIGDMYMAPRNGLLTEFSIQKNDKPSGLRLMIGATISKINYGLNSIEDEVNQENKLIGFPGVNLRVGDSDPIPESIRVENELVQFPVYLKYQAPVSERFSVFASAGPTFDFLDSQKFTYSFITIDGGQVVNKEMVERVNNSSLYLGSLGSALGFEYKVTPWFSAQSELNYRYGLEPVGVEKRDISAFSLNFNFLFKIK